MAKDTEGQEQEIVELDDASFAQGIDVHDGAESIFDLIEQSDAGQAAFDVVDGDDEGAADDPGDIEVPDEMEDVLDEEFEDEEEVDDDESDEEDEEDIDDEADDEDDDEVEDETADDDAPQTYTVKVDGEEFEVTLDEALAGYQRQQAFTRKTQQLAEERKALSEEREVIRDAQAEYGQYLNVAEQLIQHLAGEKPDASLKQSNPTAYAEQLAAWQEGQERLEVIEQERKRLAAEAAEEAKATRAEKVREASEQLQAMIPAWVDDEVASAELNKIGAFVKDQYGVSDQELASVVDARWIDLMRRAMLYTEIQEGGDQIADKKRKRKSKAKRLKAGGKPNTGKKRKKSSRSKSGDAAAKRLRKSGSIDDAAEAIFDFLD